MSGSTFNSIEVAIFWRYIASSLDRLVQLSKEVDPIGLHWQPPVPSSNSIATLIVHTLGNAEENVLETLCGLPVGRIRENEFQTESETIATLDLRWRELRTSLEGALVALPTDALGNDITHPRRGSLQGREVLIVVARHAAEHLGQAELTRDLWNASR